MSNLSSLRTLINVQLPGGSADANVARQSRIAAEAAAATALRVTQFGAVADGTTNCAAALVAAMAAAGPFGGRVLFTAAALPYLINTRVDIPANIELVFEDGAQVSTTLGTVFRVTGANVRIVNLWLRGAHSTSVYMIEVKPGADDCSITGLLIENGNSGVRLEARRAFVRGRLHELRGTAVRISRDLTTLTSVEDCDVDVIVRNAASFGVYVTDAPFARARVNVSHFTVPALFTAWQIANRPEAAEGRMGIEGVGVTVNSPEGVIGGRCYRHGSGDAGLTFSSDDNVCDMVVALDCKLTGCSILGSRNMVGVVKADSCERGLSFSPNAGGFAQDNIVGTAYVTNNRQEGVFNSNEQYREWVSGGTFGDTVAFCLNGLNVYRCSPETDTFGTIPPTHTSGTVSDGVVNWTYVSSAPTIADASGNYVGQVKGFGNVAGLVVNGSSGTLSVGHDGGGNGVSSWGGFVPNAVSIPSGNPRGLGAVDWQTERQFASQVASGDYATIIGGRRNRVAGTDAIGGGFDCEALNTGALALGASNTANAPYARAFGRYSHTQGRYGVRVEASYRFGTRTGSAQSISAVLAATTTSTTPVRLTADGAAADNANTVRMLSNGTLVATIRVMARDKASSAYAAWFLTVSASRTGAADTVVVAGGGAALAPTQSRGGGSAWRLAVDADLINGAIALTGTGASALTVEWVGEIAGVEQTA